MQSVTAPKVEQGSVEVSDETPAVHLNLCESVYSTVENAAIYHSSVGERGREYVDVLEIGTGWSTGHRVYPINHTNNALLPHQQKIQRNLSSILQCHLEKEGKNQAEG